MAVDIVMPQMGESIFEGTITKWLKKPGDKVERDEPLFEISTDKVDAEIPSPSAGVLKEIKVGEGKTVPIQTVVGVIDAAGDGAGAAKSAAPDQAPAPTPAPKAAEPARAPAPAARPQIVPHPLPLPDLLPPPHQRVPPANAFTARRSSAAWPRSTASTSPLFPAPARAAASANKISRPTLPAALNPPLKPMNPRSRRRPTRRPLRLRSAPPLRLLRRLPLPAASPTWPSSPPCHAKKCTSATTKCSP